MAGGQPIDPAQCAHYASFASHLDRKLFDCIYWLLFVLVILMLFLSSWKYSGDLDKIRLLGLEPGTRPYRHRMKKCMIICSLYAAVSVVAVVMEVYVLMALQFCDGEDLMSLYWSTWTMMQVGSLIAILGIMLSVFNSLRGNKNPPWALALGTPVLVVAGIGHAVHGAVHKRVQRARSRSRSRRRALSTSANSSVARLELGGDSAGLPMSRELTLRADDNDERKEVSTPINTGIPAHFLGFTPSGAPILRFAEDPGRLDPERGIVVGKDDDGQIMVAFKKAMALAGEGDLESGNNYNNNNNGNSNSNNGISNGNGNGNGNGNYTSLARGPGGIYYSSPSRANSVTGGLVDSAPTSRSGTPGPRSPVIRIAPPPPGRNARNGDSPV